MARRQLWPAGMAYANPVPAAAFMKIAPKALESYLKLPDGEHRAALVYGVDGGLVRERAQRIRQAVLAGNDDPFALVEIE